MERGEPHMVRIQHGYVATMPAFTALCHNCGSDLQRYYRNLPTSTSATGSTANALGKGVHGLGLRRPRLSFEAAYCFPRETG